MSERDEALTKLGVREVEVSIVLTLPVTAPAAVEDRLVGALSTYAADLMWVREAGIRKLTVPVDDLLFLHNEAALAADVMLGLDNGGTWGSFTCTEIEALADIFRAAGRGDVADFIIAEHGESDEDDDMHTKEEPDA
jgi:hypothetical protein